MGDSFLSKSGLSYLWAKIKDYVQNAIVTPSFSIGTVTTGAAGSSASASITGTDAAPVLNLTIPRGNTGNTGVHIGSSAPTDSAVNVWIDTSDDIDIAYAETATF